ncbi:MAG: precorrin-2 C(20)-methyltransferase [Deltaproteobacteria bacterium]|nr:precorrin-2 C(20)-methyltransferase [Deltaproteobacteria bacterium]
MSGQAYGTLYGIGVGPGDPELVTIKAAKVLSRVEVVFAASSPKNGYSLALNTVAELIPAGTQVVKLAFPMTSKAATLKKAWHDNAHAVRRVLEKGSDAAFLTIGDPLTYSTYGYLLETLRGLGCGAPVVTIPGVTAYHAAAARLNIPLVESNQSLVVVSGVGDPQSIRRLSEFSENIVIMKAYRRFDDIIDTVEHLPYASTVSAVSQIGLPDEQVVHDATVLKGQEMPYLTLCVVKRQRGGKA